MESATTTGMKTTYLAYIQRMRAVGIEQNERLRREWTGKPAGLRGPEPRTNDGARAIIDAFLYTVTGQAHYAESAVQLLAAHDHLLYEYVRAYGEVADSPFMTPELRGQIEVKIADQASLFLKHHVEWGAMNHATNYIVDGMTAATRTLPHHPQAGRWTQFAQKMLATSWGKWGIEDSQNYSPIWFMPLVNYADLTGNRDFFAMPTTCYYFHYYLHLLSPASGIPEFGDGGWGGAWDRYVCLLERGAVEYRNGEMKYAARRVFETFQDLHTHYTAGPFRDYNWAFSFGARLTDAYRWADDTVEEQVPAAGSEEVLDDSIGKKVVFRNGWDRNSTYLFLNYMDVPPFGVDGRDELRTTIPVETEKTHHGHADENAICLLMSRGAVLLGESGYRETDTTGPSGEFRADTYHNRVVARRGIADPQMRLLPSLLDSGRYRFVSTKSLHFHTLRAVDVSRTRLTDQETGYQWDRVVTYLKAQDIFVLFDVVKVLKAGEYTFANLLYGQRLVDVSEGRYQVRNDDLGFLSNIPNPDTASLVICFPDREGKREGVEHIRRAYQTQACVYQARSDRFEAGAYVTFTTVLIPLPTGAAPDSLVQSIAPITASEGAPGVGIRMANADGDRLLCVKLDPEAAYLDENVRPRYTYESGRSRYGDLETDARFAYLEISSGKVAYAFIEATKLLYAGRELFASPPVLMRQDDGTHLRTGVVRWRAWEDEAAL